MIHWSTHTMAEEIGVSHVTVSQVSLSLGLEPHRSGTFKPYRDPFFVEKVLDILGLYLNRPESALVLCVDKKRQYQALECSQPTLSLGAET
jgi:putative transposase